MTTIQVIIKSVYGQDKAYPANDAARTLAAIAGTSTLLGRTLRQALALGLTIEVLDRFGTVSKTFDHESRNQAIVQLAGIA